jgi:hypothetical protein
MLPLSFYSSAQSAVSGAVAASHARTSLQMGGSGGVEIKPWDVKQEGGQRDSGWGTGESHCFLSHTNDRHETYAHRLVVLNPHGFLDLKCQFSTLSTDCVSSWSAETKCHSRDPKPTVLDTTDPKAKQTYVPPSETFEEYMKRRAAQAGKKQEVVQARPAASSMRAGSSQGYSAMFLR